MRRWVALGAVTAVIAVTVACSYYIPPECPNGVFPFDGQTAVPLDTVIVVQTGEPLPPDAPPLDGTVTLRTANGEDVPFTLTADQASGELRIVPDEPLEPGTRYELGAVDWYALGEYPHWWGPTDWGRDFSLTTFSTRSRPELLALYPAGDDATFVLAFSEPVDLASLEGRLWWGATATDLFEETVVLDLEVAVLGRFDDSDHLVWIEPIGVEEGILLGSLRLDPGAVATSGEPLEGRDAAFVGEASMPIERFSGQPFCFLGAL